MHDFACGLCTCLNCVSAAETLCSVSASLVVCVCNSHDAMVDGYSVHLLLRAL
jgi:hypothetical protein